MKMVSIIVPIYNVEPYLRECIESVLAQTYQDYELILVDDGSPDGSGAICDEYSGKDQRIRVIHKVNGGLSDARNAGLDAATGKYVYFLDGDDTIEPNLLETAVRHMRDDTDLVVFHYHHLYADGKKEDCRDHLLGTFLLDSVQKRKDFLITRFLPFKLGWEAWSRMYLREKIEKYALRFADNRKIFAEDLYFCLCYCTHAQKVVSIDDCLYNYRQRDDSIMGVQKVRINIGRINELGKEVLAYFNRFEDCRDLVEQFHSIHYLIIASQLLITHWQTKLPLSEFRQAVVEDVKDWAFLEQQVKKQLRNRNEIKGAYKGKRAAEVTNYMRYLIDGNEAAFRIRRRLIHHCAPLLERFSHTSS